MPRGVSYNENGGPDVLTLGEVATPQPGPGEIRIRVAATSANLIDVKLRSGQMPVKQQFPVVPGVEATGTVDAVGEDVTDVAVGDRVFGSGRGTFAEYAILTGYAPVPSGVDDELAASVSTIGETAVRGLGYTGVHEGQTVLIHGAAGGVGATAVQLAVRQGINVIGTASEKDFDFVRGLGATPVAYGAGWLDRVREVAPDGVDGVLDTAGAGVLPESIELAGGTDSVVTIADPAAADLGVRFTGDPSERRYDSYPLLAQLLADDALTIRIAGSYPLDDAIEVHRALERGGTSGKLVVRP